MYVYAYICIYIHIHTRVSAYRTTNITSSQHNVKAYLRIFSQDEQIQQIPHEFTRPRIEKVVHESVLPFRFGVLTF